MGVSVSPSFIPSVISSLVDIALNFFDLGLFLDLASPVIFPESAEVVSTRNKVHSSDLENLRLNDDFDACGFM